MLAAAPWSLAVFTLSLPFALLTPAVPVPRLAVRCARAGQPDRLRAHELRLAPGRQSRGRRWRGARSAGEARHLVLLAALAIGVTYLARICGDLPFVLYALLDGKNDTVFFACLTALMALIWLPVLYALAVAGLSLPSRSPANMDSATRARRCATRAGR